MKLDILPIGLYEENSYVLHDAGHVLLVDPGRYPKVIAEKISQDETVDGIVLTHGHSDHTMAADDLADLYHCMIYLNDNDRMIVTPGARLDGTESPIYHEIKNLAEGDLKVGFFDLKIYCTPGHTAGSVCIQYRNILFTGDTLFAGDCGRTDLYSGSEAELIESLHALSRLPKDLKVYPGHGPSSTIGQELRINSYLK
jgi:glyoxylase-like metal-dependent hydrolase (beta-lactamase superfamily II)